MYSTYLVLSRVILCYLVMEGICKGLILLGFWGLTLLGLFVIMVIQVVGFPTSYARKFSCARKQLRKEKENG